MQYTIKPKLTKRGIKRAGKLARGEVIVTGWQSRPIPYDLDKIRYKDSDKPEGVKVGEGKVPSGLVIGIVVIGGDMWELMACPHPSKWKNPRYTPKFYLIYRTTWPKCVKYIIGEDGLYSRRKRYEVHQTVLGACREVITRWVDTGETTFGSEDE